MHLRVPFKSLPVERLSHDRRSPSELAAIAERALSDPILEVVFESVDGYALVLDGYRQILAANEQLLQMLGVERGQTIVGERPGEALGCVNATRTPEGCGGSSQCRHCGALAAILAAQVSEHPITGTCVITRQRNGHSGRPRSTDFQLRIRPLMLGVERVYVLVMHDITAIKWRELQERMFQHDLANMVMGLSGWTDELAESTASEAAAEVIALVDRLRDTLQTHRLIMKSEAGELPVARASVDFGWIASGLRSWFTAHECARDRHFDIIQPPQWWPLETDGTLLMRVLANLVKNAFEASPPGSTVTLTASPTETETVFEIHNQGHMSNQIMQHLFKGRFSTKGTGRGLGLSAVQILGEHLLGGRIDFSSDELGGTVFRFSLPNAVPVTVPHANAV